MLITEASFGLHCAGTLYTFNKSKQGINKIVSSNFLFIAVDFILDILIAVAHNITTNLLNAFTILNSIHHYFVYLLTFV